MGAVETYAGVGGHALSSTWPPRKGSRMSPLKTDVADYLLWLRVHNYAETTITCRERYLDYFCEFCRDAGVHERDAVTLELIQDYQQHLFDHRKANGQPLSF